MKNSTRTIYALCGVPGSGKSYYGKKLKDQYNAVYLSSDEIREKIYGNADIQANPEKVFMVMDSMAFEALENGYDIIYDTTMAKKKDRINFIKKFKEYNLVLIIIDTPLEICIERNQSRDRQVPVKVIEKLYNRLHSDFPNKLEGWDDIIVINN